MTHNRNLRLDIQGLRALAVILVMIYHANKTWLPAGFLGVDIFFVISGFIISTLLFKGEYDWKNFIIGRVKRILPAYLALLAGVSWVGATLLISKDFSFFRDSLQSAIAFDSNRYFASFSDYYAPSSHELPLLHTWSLAIEMQFYILLPLILIVTPRRYLPEVLPVIFGASIAYSMWAISEGIEGNYFSLATRVSEFFVGVLLAYHYKRIKLSNSASSVTGLIGLATVLVSAFYISESQVPGPWTLIPCLGVALIIASAHGPVAKALSIGPMVWIGGISYSLYLWHWPILAYIRYVTQQYELSLLSYVSYFVLSFILAWISYKLIETPVRKLKKLPMIAVASVALAIPSAIVIFYGAAINNKLSPQLSTIYTKYGNAREFCHNRMLKDCTKGEKGAATKVLVIGDSHTGQLNKFFDYIGKNNNIAFTVISSGGCIPIHDFPIKTSPKHSQKICSEQRKIIQGMLHQYSTIVMASRWSLHRNKESATAITNFVSAQAHAGKKVIILSQTPEMKGNVIRTLRHNALGLESLTAQQDGAPAKDPNTSIKKMVSELSSPNIVYVDLYDSELFGTVPMFQGHTIYSDSNHLNEFGAIEYAKRSGQKLVDVITKPDGIQTAQTPHPIPFN